VLVFRLALFGVADFLYVGKANAAEFEKLQKNASVGDGCRLFYVGNCLRDLFCEFWGFWMKKGIFEGSWGILRENVNFWEK
jgi:hypothetical protein